MRASVNKSHSNEVFLISYITRLDSHRNIRWTGIMWLCHIRSWTVYWHFTALYGIINGSQSADCSCVRYNRQKVVTFTYPEAILLLNVTNIIKWHFHFHVSCTAIQATIIQYITSSNVLQAWISYLTTSQKKLRRVTVW